MSHSASKKPQTAFRISDIEYTNSQIDDKIIGVFRFEPSGASKKGPSLIVLAEIDGVGYVYDQLIDVVNNEAEHSRTLLSNVEQEPVAHFEKIIQNINRAVADFLKEETSPINWSRVNIFILELSDGHLCLAGIGQLMNLFLQHQPDGGIKTFDLFGSLDQRVDIDPEKVFSNIICGDFAPDDILIAGSRNFERIRNELRIKERLSSLPPVTAGLEIKQELEDRNIPDDFVATIITCKAIEEPATVAPQALTEKDRSTSSMESLQKTEAETLRHLAPSISRKEGKAELKEPIAPRIGKADLLKKGLRFIQSRFKREKVNDVASMVNLRGMHDGFGSFLTRKKKTIIIGLIIVIGGIFITGSILKHQRNTAAERAAWNATYDEIKSQIETAEGEFEYSEDRARKTLASALNTLNSLDGLTEERQSAIDGLKENAETVRKKLQRLIESNNTEAIYTLEGSISDGALYSPILFNDELVFADRANEKVTIINKDGESRSFDLPTASTLKNIVAGKTSLILVYEESLYAMDPDDGSTSSLTFGASDAKGLTDAQTYSSRLYVLDAETEQIYRHNNISGGFAAGTEYLQASSANLKDAVSLAIDSNVYILKADGTVARYYAGGQDGFALSTIDPPLMNGNQIWTDTDSDYVVIADKQGKRVIIFTKEGRLVAQYVSSKFKGPTDLIGNPQTGDLYIMDGNSVYKLLLP